MVEWKIYNIENCNESKTEPYGDIHLPNVLIVFQVLIFLINLFLISYLTI